MELLFLISEASSSEGHQLIQSVTSQSHPIIVFHNDFENVPSTTDPVIWILFDVKRNADILAQTLKALPAPNYVVNLSGQGFADVALDALKHSCGSWYKEKERGRPELTLDGIVSDSDGDDCKIFVNVVETRSGLKMQSKKLTKGVGKLFKGAKKKIDNLTGDSDDSDEENAPLINTPRNRNSGFADEDPAPQGFLSCLLSFCLPCFFKPPEPEYCFHSPEELRRQMRSEQLFEIQRKLGQLHQSSLSKWEKSLNSLSKKEAQRISELRSEINDLMEQKEQGLTSVKDQQNRNTRNNLSGVLSEEAIRKIEASRSRQTQGTVEYDAERRLQQGETRIASEIAGEKAQLRERHYNQFLKDQVQKLREINVKYERKREELHARYFRNRV